MSVNNRGKKILLVDDDQALRTVLAEQLDLYDGFNTIQVGTAAEGLEKAKLARMEPVQFKAKDGLMIHGYLTKPVRQMGKKFFKPDVSFAMDGVEKGTVLQPRG